MAPRTLESHSPGLSARGFGSGVEVGGGGGVHGGGEEFWEAFYEEGSDAH